MIRTENQTVQTVCETGVKKAQRPAKKMLILAILAGVYIGFGAQLATTLILDAAQYIGLGLSNVLAGVVFSVGLILVLIAGAELFTGNNLLCVSYLCNRITGNELLKNWTIVYIGNFIGSILLAWIIFNTGLYATGGNALGLKAIELANNKVNLSFSQAFFRGLACNWLVCLALWMASKAENNTGKILSVIFPITAFVASGFEHSIANMYFIPMGIFLKGVGGLAYNNVGGLVNLTWGGFIAKNLIPVTLGNIVGGAFFVAILYCYIYTAQENEINPFFN